MQTDPLERAFDFIDSHPALARFAGPRPLGLVTEVERELGLRLPTDYRRFVLRYGCGSFASEEIYGFLREDFRRSGAVPDAAWATEIERERADLPAQMLLVYANGDGSYCALDCSEGASAGHVIQWRPGRTPQAVEPAPVATTFGEFLLARVRDALVQAR